MLKSAGLGVLGLLVALVSVSFLLPRTAHVERSLIIAAPPATVFTVLDGFRQFNRWSPWAKLDPAATYQIDGPVTGVGAHMSWRGNDKVGSGSQTLIESVPYTRIRSKLEFSGFEGTDSVATWTLKAEGGGVRVTWALDTDARNSFPARWFGVFMDRAVGPDCERGLAQLKTFAESLPKDDFSGLALQVLEAPALPVVYVSTGSAGDDRALGVALGVAYGKLSGFIDLHGLRQTAPPVAIFQPAEGGMLRFDAGIPVDRIDIEASGGVRLGHTPAGTSLKAVYQGPYAGLAGAHRRLAAYLAASGYQRSGPWMEQYVSDPSTTADAALVTHIYYPVK